MIGLLFDAIDMLEAKLEYKEKLYRRKKTNYVNTKELREMKNDRYCKIGQRCMGVIDAIERKVKDKTQKERLC